MVIIILKVLFLFLAILYGARCFFGVKQGVGYSSFHAIFFDLGATGFITLQWLI